MFSQEPRQLYRTNQLAEVICQLRFPEILTISANLPVEFQEIIRDAFPQYTARQEVFPPRLTGAPGNLNIQNQSASVNYQFASSNGIWRINLTNRFISLSCRQYDRWESFAKKLDKPLAAFIKLYKPAYFERVGLRYLNFISRRALQLEDIPYSQLLNSCWLGPLGQMDVSPAGVFRCSVDTELTLRGGCRARIHAGPGAVKRDGLPDPEVKFIFDLDLFMPGKVPVTLSADALQTLHSQAFPIFRGAITDTLHEAMEPEIV